ncbi:MAG: hypothetical protein D6813_13855 [Calditrichaeota bacterium]|nr:MAG: hypothetical protein D6813_13855 [Calditrichota bacterium]
MKVAIPIFCFVIMGLFVFQPLFGQNWWEEEKARQQSGTIVTYEGNIGGNGVKALANYEHQYMEFEASATVDMKEMENEVQAELMAKSAAELRAYAEAAKFISGVMVGAVYNAEKTLAKDEQVIGKVEKTLVKFARKIEDKVEWRNNVPLATVKLGVLFQNKNGLIDMVIPAIIEQTHQLGISPYQPQSNINPPGNLYTGVIIDARGLNVSPSIAPMILTGTENRQVYGSLTVSRDYAVQNGIVGYYKTMEAAKSDVNRVGNNPLVIQAEKTAINNHHLCINETDATRIYGADLQSGFLKECRVGIVVD